MLFRILVITLGLTAVGLSQVKFSAPLEISDYLNQPRDVQAVDMNGDGFPDLICRENFGGKIVWWQNDGSGQFMQRHVKEWEDLSYGCFALGDANSDGRPDAWLYRQDEEFTELLRVYVSYAQPNATFAEPVLIHPSWTKGEGLLLDCNGDGRLDLLKETEILLQNSDATFTHVTGAEYQDSYPSTVVGRFVPEWGGYQIASEGRIRSSLPEYGSGVVDLLSLETPNRKIASLIKAAAPEAASLDRLWIVTHDADKSIESFALARVSIAAGGGCQIDQEIAIPCDGVYRAKAFRDGEVVRFMISSYDRMLMVTVSDSGSSAVVSTLHPFSGKNSCAEFDIKDLNDDGLEELVIATSDVPFRSGPYFSQMMVMNLSAGGFPTNSIQNVNQGNLAKKILWAGDYDLDGDQDFITDGRSFSDFSGKILLWKNSGGGVSFTTQVLFEKNAWLDLIDVTDVNLDGLPDLIIWEEDNPPYEGYGTLSIHLNHATNNLPPVPFFLTNSPFVTNVCFYADANGDGIKDIVDQGKVILLDGSRDIVETKTLSHGLSVMDFEFFDVDHDGDNDLYFTAMTPGSFDIPVSFYSLNDGNAVFGAVTILGDGSPRVLSADIDGDGHRDYFDADGLYEIPGTEFVDYDSYLLSRSGVNLVRPEWEGLLTGTGVGLDLFHLDIDGDQDADVLHSYTYNFTTGIADLGWLEHRGNSLGIEPQRIILPEQEEIAVHRKIAPYRYLAPDSAMMVDIDGDGLKDILCSYFWNRKIEWFRVTKPVVPASYDGWMSSLGWKGHSAGPLEDLDGDGKNNWHEFVFQTDPLIPDENHPNEPHLSIESGLARFEFRCRGDVPGVVCQWSHDLVEWFNREDASSVLDEITGLRRWTWETPLGQGRKFFRVRFPSPEESQ